MFFYHHPLLTKIVPGAVCVILLVILYATGSMPGMRDDGPVTVHQATTPGFEAAGTATVPPATSTAARD